MMRKYLIALFAPLALAACTTVSDVPTSPGSIADTTVLDERAAIAVESGYRAAGLALEVAVDAGYLRGSNATRAANLERRAYTAVLAVRAAYDAGNAATYAEALTTARTAIAAAFLAVNGE